MYAKFHTTALDTPSAIKRNAGKCSLTLIDITWTAFKFQDERSRYNKTCRQCLSTSNTE